MINVSIIIPVYNEENTIIDILKVVKGQKVSNIKFEVIVVDDGSNDNTGFLLNKNKHLYDKIVINKKNSGKGFAIKQGINVAKGSYILFQDADMEYDPNDYKNILRPVKNFNADLVIGSRLSGPPVTRVSYFWNKQGNRLITFLFNLFYNTTFTDIYSCYVVIKKNLLNINKIKTNGWEQQAEILSQVVLKSKVIFEVPINYFGRSYEEGKKIRPYHIFKIIFIIIYKRFI
tara:strand:- start:693 stop:1385 length:693 start_codon:yes stop_codon:yes gene_type:complete